MNNKEDNNEILEKVQELQGNTNKKLKIDKKDDVNRKSKSPSKI